MSRSKDELIHSKKFWESHLDWLETDFSNRPDTDLVNFRPHAEVAEEEIEIAQQCLAEVNQALKNL